MPKPRASEVVLDASALIAFAEDEPGAQVVGRALDRAVIGTVNLSEVVAVYAGRGAPVEDVVDILRRLRLVIVPFDEDLAFRAGRLRPVTRRAGLSFGDRACLALASRMRAPVLTADRAWASLGIELEIRVIR